MACVVDGVKSICDQFKVSGDGFFADEWISGGHPSHFSCFSHSADVHRVLLAQRRGYLVIRITNWLFDFAIPKTNYP
jgi:hypothetical protein